MLFQKKKKLPAPDRAQLPRHIAVVMDGNGRWAQKRGMPRTFGHSAGSETFQKDAEYLSDLGIFYRLRFFHGKLEAPAGGGAGDPAPIGKILAQGHPGDAGKEYSPSVFR